MSKKTVIWLIKSKPSKAFKASLTYIKSKIDIRQHTFVAIVNHHQEIMADVEMSKLFDRLHGAKLHISPKNHLYLFDYQELANIVALEKKQLQTHEQLYVMGIDEINLLSVAKLREQFDLFGVKYHELLPFRDKHLMNEHLLSHGFKVPKHLPFSIDAYKQNSKSYYQEITQALSKPFLLKPTQSAGTLGIKKISCLDDFMAFEQDCDKHTYIINEFIHGKQYHCESIIQNGKFVFEACAQYLYPPIENVMGEKILSSTPVLPDCPMFEKIIEYNRNILRSLDLPNLSSTLEFYCTGENDFVFVELNGRLPGEPMDFVYYRQFNVWMSYIDFLVQTDHHITVDTTPLTSKRNVAWAFIPQKSGEIVALNRPSLNSDMTLSWHKKIGDVLDTPISVYDHVGMLIFETENRADFLADMNVIRTFPFLLTTNEVRSST